MKHVRILSSVLAAFMILLAACGGSQGGNGKVTINWWHINTTDPLKTGWQDLATAYMKTHPNVDIKITVIENDPFKTKLNTAMQAGTPPDLFQSWGGGVLQQYASAGLVKDISSDLKSGGWGDSFTPAVLNLYSSGGKFYGVPWDAGAVGFWYNKTLFAQAGITGTPATWDDFIADISKLKAAGITPLVLGEKDQWPGAFYWEYLAVRLGGQDAFNKAYNRSGGSFKDDAFVQAGTYLKQLVDLQPFQNGFLGSSYDDHQAIMGNGQGAMELMGQWAPANDIAKSTDKKGPEFGYFSFPSIPGGKGTPTDALGGGNGFAVGKNAPPEAIDFLKFLTSADNLRPLAAKGALLPPVPAAQDGVTDPNALAVLAQLKSASYYQLYYDQFMTPAVGNTVNQQVAGLFAGTSSPSDVASAVDASAASNK